MTDTRFPLDQDGRELAWPSPTGGYVDAWNGWYPDRAAALADAPCWTARESDRTRAYGDDVVSQDDL